LYPGEELEKSFGKTAIQPLEVIHKHEAINLVCLDDITDENGVKRLAGEEYQLLGPLIYLVRSSFSWLFFLFIYFIYFFIIIIIFFVCCCC